MTIISQTITTGDPVAWLEQDHQLIRQLLDQLVLDADGPSRQRTLDELKSLLSLHNAIEESLIYPAIAEIAQRKDQAALLFHQTAEADIAVFALQRALLERNNGAFTSTAPALRSAILDHISVEETAAFPLLSQAAPPQMKMLAEQIVEFKRTLTSPRPIS